MTAINESALSRAENPYGKILIGGICAVILFIVIAYSFPGFLVQSANPTSLSYKLNVGSSVYLYYSGTAHIWPTGTYGPCYILSTYTDCANAGTGSSSVYGFAFILLAFVAVAFCMILMLVIVRRSQE